PKSGNLGKGRVHFMGYILQSGIREGKIEGKKEGIKEGKIELTVSLIRDGLLSISEGAKRLDMEEEELKKYL
ncbi:MAG: hypothetical protein Q4C77_09365, partial [Eubacteriales bacterium]|nr:hypothetical protein [Eubacteriales bacterium]